MLMIFKNKGSESLTVWVYLCQSYWRSKDMHGMVEAGPTQQLCYLKIILLLLNAIKVYKVQYVSWTAKIKEFRFRELKQYQRKSNIFRRIKPQKTSLYLLLILKTVTMVLTIKPKQRDGICRKFLFCISVSFIILSFSRMLLTHSLE